MKNTFSNKQAENSKTSNFTTFMSQKPSNTLEYNNGSKLIQDLKKD